MTRAMTCVLAAALLAAAAVGGRCDDQNNAQPSWQPHLSQPSGDAYSRFHSSLGGYGRGFGQRLSGGSSSSGPAVPSQPQQLGSYGLHPSSSTAKGGAPAGKTPPAASSKTKPKAPVVAPETTEAPPIGGTHSRASMAYVGYGASGGGAAPAPSSFSTYQPSSDIGGSALSPIASGGASIGLATAKPSGSSTGSGGSGSGGGGGSGSGSQSANGIVPGSMKCTVTQSNISCKTTSWQVWASQCQTNEHCKLTAASDCTQLGQNQVGFRCE